MSIIGVDVGTTGCKCTVYDINGVIKNEAYMEYKVNIDKKFHTLNPEIVWKSVKKVIKIAAKNINDIKGIGVTSFGEAAIILDENNQSLKDSMLYTDIRGEKQCEKIISEFGITYINEKTGLNPSPMYSISKLMWLKENRNELMDKCKRICLFEDYIVYMLSGIHQIDYSLASRTMAFDINTLKWDDNILNYAGIDKALMPKLVAIGSKAGKIKPEVAAELDINGQILIVSGCHDQIAASIGTGATKENMAVDGTGTVECITPVFTEKVDKNILYKGSYAIIPFLNNNYVTYAFSFTGGALLKWYRDKIAYMEAEVFTDRGESAYENFNEQININEPSDILVLPHFAGAATPYMDNNARGAMIGLSIDTTSIQIYQALMEGVTYEMLLNIERLEEAGITIDTLYATGGGAASEEWLQMKANILNRSIVTLKSDQSGTLGCAMLVGIACGLFENIDDATKKFVKIGKTYNPELKMHNKYMKLYIKYKKMYNAVKDILEE